MERIFGGDGTWKTLGPVLWKQETKKSDELVFYLRICYKEPAFPDSAEPKQSIFRSPRSGIYWRGLMIAGEFELAVKRNTDTHFSLCIMVNSTLLQSSAYIFHNLYHLTKTCPNNATKNIYPDLRPELWLPAGRMPVTMFLWRTQFTTSNSGFRG